MDYTKFKFSKPVSKKKKRKVWPKTQGCCIVCGEPSMRTPHHIVTRGAFGSDDRNNLIDLCVKHHSEVESIGRVSFFKKYKIIKLLEIALKLKYAENKAVSK